MDMVGSRPQNGPLLISTNRSNMGAWRQTKEGSTAWDLEKDYRKRAEREPFRNMGSSSTAVEVNFCTSFSHWMPCKQIAGMKTNNCSLAVCPPSQTVSGWFDTKSFHYNSSQFDAHLKSIQCKLKSLFTVIWYKTLRYLTAWNYYRISTLRLAKWYWMICSTVRLVWLPF